MTPWLSSYNWAMESGVTPQEWHDNIKRCLLDGWIISTPEMFLAFRKDGHSGQPAYFVAMAYGGSGHVLKRFMQHAPEPLPWVLWHRNNEKRLRVFAWDKLAKKARI